MEEWQAKRIIELAREGNVVDAQRTTSICPGILKEPIIGIRRLGLLPRNFRFYLHPWQHMEFIRQLHAKPGRVPDECIGTGDTPFEDVPFRRHEWMPLDTILVVEPNNLAILPFSEEVKDFSLFRRPERVWVIINLLAVDELAPDPSRRP